MEDRRKKAIDPAWKPKLHLDMDAMDTTTAKELFWCAASFLVGAISLYGYMMFGWFQ